MTSAPVVVFDLDGVLVSRDSMTTYVVASLRHRPWLLPLALGPVLGMAASGRAPRVRSVSSRLVVRTALLGRDPDDADRELGDLAHGLATDHAVGDAVRAVHEHLERGHRVVVDTASTRAFARPFLDALDLRSVEVAASGLARGPGGLALHPHNYHRAKLRSAVEAGWGDRFDTVYTDSWADAPLLRRATHPVLVNPSPSTRRHAADLPGLRIVSWS